METGSRSVGIDAARLILAVAVVFAHCGTFSAFGPALDFAFNNGIARIIVPFFLLTTGFFFDRLMTRGLGQCMWRVTRIYLTWSLIFLPFILFYQHVTPIRLMLNAVFGFFHLWYLPALIGGLAVLSVLRRVPNETLLALAAGAFVTGGLIQYSVNQWLDFDALENHYDLLVLSRNFLFYGFPYLALGLLIRRGALLADLAPPQRLAWLVGALALLGVETALQYRLFDPRGFFDLNFSAFLLTPVLFVEVRDLKMPAVRFDLRPMSMVIYLSHPLFLLPIRHMTDLGPGQLTIVTLAMTLSAAPVWFWLARRLPILP